MARDRRPSRASPNKQVEFKQGLISGPSGRGNAQPTTANNPGPASNSEMTEDPDEQRQDDPTRAIALEKDDSPETPQEFFQSLQPGAPIEGASDPLNHLNDAQKDYRVCKGLAFLVDDIVLYADEKVGEISKKASKDFVDGLLIEENKQLIRYIGCIAQGGKDGFHGWATLLTDDTCRKALVVGIIGRALEEHVFSALYFGGERVLTEKLDKMEREQVDDEGFSRTSKRASAIIGSERNPAVAKFHQEVTKLTAQLSAMLDPFCYNFKVDLDLKLYSIVHHAGQLSRMMRRAPDVVYYWLPTFKDEQFQPGRMEAYNLVAMIEGSPYDRKLINDRERAILKPGRESEGEAIVRVVCFSGLVAYRQGGGALANKELAAEKRTGVNVPEDVQAHRRRGGEQPLSSSQGIRSRVIRKSLVLLQWGQQRLLTKEAGTSSHIDAVRDGKMDRYESDYKGFVELYSYAENKWKR